MNLLLLTPEDDLKDDTVTLTDRRFIHIRDILKAQPGKTLSYGLLNGGIGTATVRHIDKHGAKLELSETMNTAPPVLPLTLILSLPRPKMLQRTLQTIATMGVKHLCLIHTDKVERSFWQSPALKPETVHHHLCLGLEQAKATYLPEVSYYPKFRDFAAALPTFASIQEKWVVHPGDYPRIERAKPGVDTLAAIGPEGGFTKEEVDLFVQHGFAGVQLGPRILRVETAVPVVIGQLF